MKTELETKWNNCHQPEESGRQDGKRGLPAPDDSDPEWEGTVREDVQAEIAGIARRFMAQEKELAASFKPKKVEQRYLCDQLNKLSTADVPWFTSISLPHSLVFGVTAFLFCSVVVMLSVLLAPLTEGVVSRSLVAIVGGAVLGGFGFFSGVLYNHLSKSAWGWLIAVLPALAASALMMYVGVLHERQAAGGLGLLYSLVGVVAIMGIGVCGCDLTHPARRIHTLNQKLAQVNGKLAELAAKRRGISVEHILEAGQVVDIGQGVVMAYRDSNMSCRGDCPPPAIFDTPPNVGTVTLAEFNLLDDNNPEVPNGCAGRSKAPDHDLENEQRETK